MSHIPEFDNKEVTTSRLKIAAGSLDLDEIVAEIDEELTVRLTVQVSQVTHSVNKVTGHLNRVQIAHAVESKVIVHDAFAWAVLMCIERHDPSARMELGPCEDCLEVGELVVRQL